MAFDGLFTKAMVEELANTIESGRISKIHQPFQNEVVFIIRANGRNYRLLLSAHSQYARVQLTNETSENPQEPPMFCMVLRKHLEGAIIEKVYQIELDRMIVFEIRSRNEIGDLSYKQLIVEVMGRHSNIILVDKKQQVIIDSIKHVSHATNSYRAILPGQPYIMPPAQNKQNPLTMTATDLLQKIDFNAGRLDRQLVQHCAGLSPLFAKEILFKTEIANRKTLPKTFISTMNQLKNKQYEPTISISETKESFYMIPLQHVKGENRQFSSLSEMLDRFYFQKAERDRVKQQAHDLTRFIVNEKEKNLKKITKLQETLKKAEKSEQYRLFGELLTAHIYMLKKGMPEIEVTNYYDEDGATVTIPLDPLKTPAENAQQYFSTYDKAKTALVIVSEQINIANTEVDYLDGLLQQIETAAPRDIEGIREELIEEGYLRDRQKRTRKKRDNDKPRLEKYRASDGTEILVGKNNKQNEYLTMRLARQNEIWLHTKDIPGSHVVIRCTEPSEQTIIEAAILAAYFSKARQSSSVPVDFTMIRHVKKPNGAKPGYVIYEQQQTIFVTPSEEKVIELQAQPS